MHTVQLAVTTSRHGMIALTASVIRLAHGGSSAEASRNLAILHEARYRFRMEGMEQRCGTTVWKRTWPLYIKELAYHLLGDFYIILKVIVI